MSIETSIERSIMLADFGDKVQYKTQNAGTDTITAIFDNGYQSVDAGGNVAFAMQQPQLTCKTSDIPNASEGDTVVISGTTYTVRVVMPDGTGITELMLEKA
jgi:hypothetical protein